VAAAVKSRCDVQCRGRWLRIKTSEDQFGKHDFERTDEMEESYFFDFEFETEDESKVN
jgi:hypothetical protein